MFCGFCGQKIQKSDIFCFNCGEAVVRDSEIPEVEFVPSPLHQGLEEALPVNEVKVKVNRVKKFNWTKYPIVWKIVGALVAVLLIFTPVFFYLISSDKSIDVISSPQILEKSKIDVTLTPTPTTELKSLSPSPQIKKETDKNPSPKVSPTNVKKKEPQICRTIIQFGEEKQCFGIKETTYIEVQDPVHECPANALQNWGCEVGSKVLVPIDLASVKKPCSPGGDIGINPSAGIYIGESALYKWKIGGGSPDSIRSEYCLEKSNNVLPYILNGFPTFSFFKPEEFPEQRYELPEIGVIVIDRYYD